MTFEINKIRNDFPVLSEWTYLDNAFVGLMPHQVREGYIEWADEWHNYTLHPGETILGKWMRKAQSVRRKVASLIGVNSEEIAYTMCTGSGQNIVLNSFDWKKGDNVVFPEWEHNPPVTYETEKIGVEPRVLHQKGGRFDLSDIEELVDDNTKLVSVTDVSYVNGFKMDLKGVTEIAHEHGAKVLVDSTQTIGALNVNYHDMDVDYVSFAPYKYMMGPPGLAFLYVSNDNLESIDPDRVGWKNAIWNRDRRSKDASKLEYGTIHFQGVYAMEKSLNYIENVGMDVIDNRVKKLSGYLYDRLSEFGMEIFTPERGISPVVSYMEDNAFEIAKQLMTQKIKVTGRKAHRNHIRASVHFYNTEEDIDKLISTIN